MTGFKTGAGDSTNSFFGKIKCEVVGVVVAAKVYEIAFSFGFTENFGITIEAGFTEFSALKDQIESVSDLGRFASDFRLKSSKSMISSKSVPSLPAPKSGKQNKLLPQFLLVAPMGNH